MPDESKITNKHFIKEWGLIPVRINLSKLVEDYPETIIWGAELLPIKDKWRKLSDEAFDRKIEQEYGLTWEEFLEARSHELTLANVRKYSKMQPETLWSNYERQHIGKYYAANVPHAFIITPMGYIPYAYVEFMNPRENSRGIVVDPEDVAHLVDDIRDYIWNNWNNLKHGGRTVIVEDYVTQYVNAQDELISIPILITMTEYETSFIAQYDPVTEEIEVSLETNSLPHLAQIFNPNIEHPRWQELRQHLILNLVHEITHALDSKEEIRRQRNVYDRLKYEKEEDFEQRYFNTPVEVNAYTNQILAEIYLSDTPYSNPEDAIFATETWQHIHDMLSKKSKRLIKTRVFSRLFM